MPCFLIADPSQTIRSLIKKGLEQCLSSIQDTLDFIEVDTGISVIPTIKKNPAIDYLLLSESFSDLKASDIINSLKDLPDLEGKKIVYIIEPSQAKDIVRTSHFMGVLMKPFNAGNIQERLQPLFGSLQLAEENAENNSEEVEEQKELMFDLLSKYILEAFEGLENVYDQEILHTMLDEFYSYGEVLPENDIIPCLVELADLYHEAKSLNGEQVNQSLLESVYHQAKLDGRVPQPQSSKTDVKELHGADVLKLLRETSRIEMDAPCTEQISQYFADYENGANEILADVQFDIPVKFDPFSTQDVRELLGHDKRGIAFRYLSPFIPYFKQHFEKIDPAIVSGNVRQNELFIQSLRNAKKKLTEASQFDREKLRELFFQMQPTYHAFKRFYQEGKFPEDEPKLKEKCAAMIKAFEEEHLYTFDSQFFDYIHDHLDMLALLANHVGMRIMRALMDGCKKSKEVQSYILRKKNLPDMEFHSLSVSCLKTLPEEQRKKFALLYKEVKNKTNKHVAYITSDAIGIELLSKAIGTESRPWKYNAFVQVSHFETFLHAQQPTLILIDHNVISSERKPYWKVLVAKFPHLKQIVKIIVILEENAQIRKTDPILNYVAGYIKKPLSLSKLSTVLTVN